MYLLSDKPEKHGGFHSTEVYLTNIFKVYFTNILVI